MLPISATMIAATLPARNWTPIPHYPVIVTDMNIDVLLDVRR